MANRLAHEQSPYLLQHAHNPVDWYPWGDEPFERAAKEQKPVLVSIGYAACHWCHVMERESFEDAQVAAYMNEHFICIKVDREEHPDVDHLYMDAVQAIGGSGGWPLNVFVTPGRLPFYGGTYYPPRPAFNRPSWPGLLQRIHEIWTTQHEEVAAQSEQMLQHLRQSAITGTAAPATDLNMDTCRLMADTLLKQADVEWGGFGNAPKFPGTMAITFLLEHDHFTASEAARTQALRSLDAMIEGGIYDQLGGGFARYATDREWLIPHFEKMLYDNALIISSLCDAYKLTKNETYATVIRDTIAFVERELKDASGIYYSAIDADSEGVEGKFYTFTWLDWRLAIGDDDPDGALAAYFGVSELGNWEHTNILHVDQAAAKVAADKALKLSVLLQRIEDAKKKLLQFRNQKIRPITDDKSLLSWNALMNIALVKAGTALADDTYLQRARQHMDLLLQHFASGNDLLHVWKQGRARISAKLDDYAYTVQALLQLGSASGHISYILEADKWMKKALTDFLHEKGTFFYYSSMHETGIPVRKVDNYDGATPSANAVMAHNLLLLSACMENTAYAEQAEFMLSNISSLAQRYTYSFSYWAMLLQRYVKGLKTAIISGPGSKSATQHMAEQFIPQAFILTLEKEIFDIPLLSHKFSPTDLSIFVCTRDACLSPVSNAGAALAFISQ